MTSEQGPKRTLVGLGLRTVSLSLLLFVFAGALLTFRAVRDGTREMEQSDLAFNQGEVKSAVLHARRAAIAYAPGAPHVRAAYERMLAAAEGAEAAGDLELARYGFGAVRGAALETRHIWTPHQADLEHADRALARLQALALTQATNPEARRESLERAYEELKHRDSDPVWVAILGLGFALSVAGLALTGFRGVSPDGKLSLRRALLGLVIIGIGISCWTLAVYQA